MYCLKEKTVLRGNIGEEAGEGSAVNLYGAGIA
jgi:hypothetical protein